MNMINFIVEPPAMCLSNKMAVTELGNDFINIRRLYIWKHVTKHVIYDWQLHKDTSHVHQNLSIYLS